MGAESRAQFDPAPMVAAARLLADAGLPVGSLVGFSGTGNVTLGAFRHYWPCEVGYLANVPQERSASMRMSIQRHPTGRAPKLWQACESDGETRFFTQMNRNHRRIDELPLGLGKSAMAQIRLFP